MALLLVPVAMVSHVAAAASSNILSHDNSGSIFLFLSRVVTTILFLIVSVYYVLRMYPTLLHTRKQLGSARSKVSIIGHRGSTNDGLVENTKAAFKDAIRTGVDVIELDVWMTVDKQVVVFHDGNFVRMTQNSRNVKAPSGLKYDDFPTLTGCKKVDQSSRCEDFSRKEWSKVPLFSDVLALIPSDSNICMIVEFKQNSDELIDAVKTLIEQYNRKDKTFWFSLNDTINKKLKKADNEIPSICSEIGILRILILYYIGLLPFFPIDDAVFGITLSEISLDMIKQNDILKAMPSFIHQMLAYIFKGSPPAIMIAPGLFTHLRARGLPVWFLGVNNLQDLALAIASGATGAITDRPNWMIKEMKQHSWKFISMDE